MRMYHKKADIQQNTPVNNICHLWPVYDTRDIALQKRGTFGIATSAP